MTRERWARIANRVKAAALREAPDGTQIVVCITDSTGEWIGVSSNVDKNRADSMLRSAILGADAQELSAIDTEGFEVSPVVVATPTALIRSAAPVSGK
jgi:hypothetical protein